MLELGSLKAKVQLHHQAVEPCVCEIVCSDIGEVQSLQGLRSLSKIFES